MTYKQIKAHQRAKGQTKAFIFNPVTYAPPFEIITCHQTLSLVASTCLFPGPVIYDPPQPNMRHAARWYQCKHIRECLRRGGFEG